ncbi:hypothetical protein ACFC1R_34520, partial [Kitasatospora sp. NPDC056138]
MVTYAQAQELAEDWINAGVPRSQQREVRVREFDLGFVCWAVDRANGPSDTAGGGSGGPGGPGTEIRLVIARESGASTLWPPLPVNEVVRQYEELYGGETAPNPAGAAKPVRGTVEATSFLLTPPQWLQEAGQAAIAAESARLGEPAGAGGHGGAPLPPPAQPVHLTAPPASGRPAGNAPTMLAPPGPSESGGTPASGVPAAGAPPFPHAPVSPEGATVPFPEGLLPGDPQGAPGFAGAVEHAPTVLASDGRFAQAGPPPVGPPPVGQPPVGGPASTGAAGGPGIEYAPTMLASDGAPGLMGLPGAPGLPGVPEGPSAAGAAGRAAPGAPPPPPPAELRGPSAPPAGPGAGGRGPSAPPPPPPAGRGGWLIKKTE